MRRISSTSLSSFALAAALLFIATSAQARWCLPPVFEGGKRLQERFHRHSSWLALSLRQHEVCWRAPRSSEEARVFLFGSSGPFGFPLPVEETLSGRLNESLSESNPAAYVFNLGYLNTYHIKDALIAHESLAYEPDVIVFAITLDDFRVFLSTEWTAALEDFFEKNHDALASFAHERPAGIAETLAQHERDFAPTQDRTLLRLRQVGRLLKSALRSNAETLTRAISREPDRPQPEWNPMENVVAGRLRFECAEVQRIFEILFEGWKERNIFAWLESLERETGIDVLVVNWPTASRPSESCYNSRYTKASFAEYNRWIAAETASRSIDYIDLHDLLHVDDFFDSIHPTADGHRKIARRLEQPLSEIVRRRAGATAKPETAIRTSSRDH